ncbi:hypothetical protein O181_068367 [Austropuccinia psidii MF-1]|uniref:Reverse transcriptase RNase H-like domain-containing protein n=1 Tax=Austropuccinia psidii MF-1 TaxID=1389203 RepID=A0A9Q3EZ63_9BASI|nr:hypothetical protein [Austropuccinia psidii MF-1]
MGIYEYTRMPFGIKNAPAHFQRMMDTIFQEEVLEGWMVVYIYYIIIYSDTWKDHVQYIERVLGKCTPINLIFSLKKKCNFGKQELLALGHKVSGLNAACSRGSGAALHQRQTVGGEPIEGVICYISRKLKDSEARYGATQTEFLCLVWYLEKVHYYLKCAVFEVYTECTALKYLLNMKTNKRHMLSWQIAIQEYRDNITIIYKGGKSHNNADGH